MSVGEPDLYSLRPLEKIHIPQIARWFGDLDALSSFDRAMRVPHSLDAAEKAWSEVLGNDGQNGKYWFSICRGEAEIVGIIGLENLSQVNRDAVIALYVEKQTRNKGVGVRAAALLLDVAFQQLGLNRVTSYYRADNKASRQLIERVGFQHEGCMRKAWFAHGQNLDMIVVGILREEWLERREGLAGELVPSPIVAFGSPQSRRWTWPPLAHHDEE